MTSGPNKKCEDTEALKWWDRPSNQIVKSLCILSYHDHILDSYNKNKENDAHYKHGDHGDHGDHDGTHHEDDYDDHEYDEDHDHHAPHHDNEHEHDEDHHEGHEGHEKEEHDEEEEEEDDEGEDHMHGVGHHNSAAVNKKINNCINNYNKVQKERERVFSFLYLVLF